MVLDFWKMNGAGNDFVVIDNRSLDYSLTREQIARLCNRQRGVGSDGLLAVEPAQKGADFRMRYYNADGGEAEMCGNGARCFARFVNKLHGGKLEKLSFETIAGEIQANFIKEHVRIGLSEPFDLRMGRKLEADGEKYTVHHVNTGVPHAVIVVDDLESADMIKIGRTIRFHEEFAPAGANVNLMQRMGDQEISIRTYERGVEDETLACGTGMVANAIIQHELEGTASPVRVNVQGGDQLTVEFEKKGDSYTDVFLTGPADFVFQGHIDIS